jgi:hypothetical protein
MYQQVLCPRDISPVIAENPPELTLDDFDLDAVPVDGRHLW